MKVIFSIITVLIGIITLQLSYFMYHYFRPPVDILELSIDTPVVKFGENITIRQKYERRDLCRVDIDRFIVNVDTQILMRRERLPAGVLPIGIGVVRTLIPTKLSSNIVIPLGIADPIMSDIGPGKYSLFEVLHYACEQRYSNSITAPPKSFEVVP